ncbi:MAG: LysR family transcriptional regulator [Firmicutes bacterium]|nr:LysR family transcriptional regulator [Bacillota bacterium]
MKLESLDSFLAVTRHGSLHQAAAALFVSQSTLTHRMQVLEEDLGVLLFVRHPGGVALTDEGRRFVPVASAILDQLQGFKRSQTQAPRLTLIAGKAFASYELPGLIAGFRKLRPELRCHVRSALFPESIDALLAGTADLAVIGYEAHHPELVSTTLASDRIVLCVHPQHRFARQFAWRDWGHEDVVAFGDVGAPFRTRVDNYLADRGIRPHIVMELDSIHAVKRMVMHNLGVAFLPERTLSDEATAGWLAIRDVAEGDLIRPSYVAYRRSRQGEPLLQAFIEWMADHHARGGPASPSSWPQSPR